MTYNTRSATSTAESTLIRWCGAKRRDGSICKSTRLLRGQRCYLHGGLSTGPKTLQGRRKSAENIGKDYDILLAEKLRRLSKITRDPTRSPHNTSEEI